MRRHRYPDAIERLLVHEEALHIPFPTEPVDYERVIRLRELPDDALLPSKNEDGSPETGDARFVPLVRAGLFYFHNALDDAHRIVQEEKAAGDAAAYWHAMIHRRERDFDNARYWLRRAGEQPSFAEMHARAADASPNMARQMGWDPFLFVTLAEQLRFGADELRAEVVGLGRVEFEVFFDYCFRRATAAVAAGGK